MSNTNRRNFLTGAAIAGASATALSTPAISGSIHSHLKCRLLGVAGKFFRKMRNLMSIEYRDGGRPF
ncbi:MAG: hypothetical protein CM15mP117_03780 [Alphaproteobacteria bacterium]|nr:MAG: hypothetical protein CM15mP117_03780 [Alphaproteobacteria bacterium]